MERERAVRPGKIVIVSLLLQYRSWPLWPLEGFPASSGIHTTVQVPNQDHAVFQTQARLDGPWAACLIQAGGPEPTETWGASL